MPNQVHELVGGSLMITINTSRPPTDEEWNDYVETYRKRGPETLRTLVFTDGGAPNSAQRKKVNEMLDGKTTRAAVISPNSMVRGVVTALSWFNPKIKVFAPEQLDDAFRYLEIRGAEIDTVWQVIRKLQSKLGGEVLRSIPHR